MFFTMLQCLLLCYNVYDYVTMFITMFFTMFQCLLLCSNVYYYFTVFITMLQCLLLCPNVYSYVTVFITMLQCLLLCYSVKAVLVEGVALTSRAFQAGGFSVRRPREQNPLQLWRQHSE